MCIAMDNLVQETPNCANQDQTLGYEQKIDPKTDFESENGPNCANQDQTLADEQKIDPKSDFQSEIDQTLVTKPEIDQTLANKQNPETEFESEHGFDDTSSNSSFKSLGVSDEEQTLAEDQYEDVPTHVEDDDVDYDQSQFCIFGQNSNMNMPRGRSSWSRKWGGNENKKVESSFSWSQPYLGEVNFDMVGAGLDNLGNTCFLNAILQCFTHTVPLIEGMRSYNHPKPCERDTEGFCVFCALHNHIEAAISRKGMSISPLKIVENLNQLSSGFRRYRQEDAHELLQCLLDKLDTCCNSSKNDDSDESLVQRLFGGRLVSKLKCCNCGHCSDTFESLIDFSLEIENATSLSSALESFTKVEKIEDEEPQFTCESCKEKVTVEKQLMVDRAPSIAAFHLKRFKNDGSCVEKIDTHVEFPLELDMNPYTSGGQNDIVDLNYSLYAIVVHSGFSPTAGHYFCFVRSAPNAWYRLNDSKAARVSESHVLSRDAYILLYAKNGTPWFSTFMETEKLSMDYNVLSSTSPISVLENAKQISESSPITEANIISEVSEEDRKEATEFYELSFNGSRHKDDSGVAKDGNKIDEKLFPSTFGDDNMVVSNISPKSIENKTNCISESSPIMETNINCDLDEEDRDDAIKISRLSFSGRGNKNKVNEARNDSKIEPSSSSPAVKGDNSNQKSGKYSKSADFNSTYGRSISPIRVSRLSFDDCTLKDRVLGAKDGFTVDKTMPAFALRGEDGKSVNVNSALRGEDGKSVNVNSSTISGMVYSAKPVSIPRDHVMTERELPCKKKSSDDVERKEASKLLTSLPLSKRRSQLLSVMSNASPKSIVDDTNQVISDSSPVMETNISCDVDVEDLDDAMEISTLNFNEVGKGSDVNSATISGLVFSAKPSSTPNTHVMTERELPCKRKPIDDRHSKEACKLLKSMPCSRRRSQLLPWVNKNPDVCLNNKKTKVNKPSSNMKDGPSNSLRNPNLVSLRRPVAPGRI